MKNFLRIFIFYSIFVYFALIFFDEISYYYRLNKIRSLQTIPLDKIIQTTKYICTKPEYIKKPIIILGCSFAWGSEIKRNETFTYKLSEQTKRPVYNYAIPGFGIQAAYYCLKNIIPKDNIKTPEAIIYVFIEDHVRRFYSPYNFGASKYIKYVDYKEKNGEMIENKFFIPYISNSYMLAALKEQDYYKNYSKRNTNKDFDNIKKYFLEMKKLVDNNYTGSKFIIILYDCFKNNNVINSERWQELEKEGIRIIKTKELKEGDKLSVPPYSRKNHPTESAWTVLVPQIAEKLKI